MRIKKDILKNWIVPVFLGVFFYFVPSDSFALTLSDNLLHYYPLQTNSEDSVGTLDGTDTDITYSSSAVFNGSSSKIVTSNFSSQSLSDFSVSVWAYYPDGVDLDYASLISTYADLGSGNECSFNLRAQLNNDGKPWFGVLYTVNGTWKTVQASNALSNNWHHIVATYLSGGGSTSVKLYIDGGTALTTASGSDSCSVSAPLTFGFFQGGGLSYFNGKLKDVGFWNRSLTSSEVAELYNSGSPLSYPFGSVPSAPVFSPSAGDFTSAQSISISSTDSTSIYYTVDGSTPDDTKSLYSSAVSLSATTTLKAVGKNNVGYSSVTSGTYNISIPSETGSTTATTTIVMQSFEIPSFFFLFFAVVLWILVCFATVGLWEYIL